MCTNCAPGALRGQKGALDPLELELQTIMGCYMGTGNRKLDPLQEQQVLRHLSSSKENFLRPTFGICSWPQ